MPQTVRPLLVACKAMLSGMQVLENYARCQCCLMYDTQASYCQHFRMDAHTTNLFLFNDKFVTC
jgi:hypothetical protein